jgi:hypothetical protein
MAETLLSANFIHEPSKEKGEEESTLDLEEMEVNALVSSIQKKFVESSTARSTKETVWLNAYQNYRGVYGKNVVFNKHEKSRVFVKITKTKVLAAYGMLVDVLFGTNSLPIGIQETDVPEGASERAHLKTNGSVSKKVETTPTSKEEENPFDLGYVGDGRVLAPGATFRSPSKFLKDSESLYTDNKGENVLEEGPSPDPSIPEINPAKESARRLQKLIHDQITESNGEMEIRNCLFEMALLGTGIVKGPFNYNKTLHNWAEDGEGNRVYQPIQVRVPRCEFVSCWDSYPDANCTSSGDLEYFIQRRKMTESQMIDLKNRPSFDKEVIARCLLKGPKYNLQSFEQTIRSDDSAGTGDLFSSRYEVLEYWGNMNAGTARNMGIKVSESIDPLSEVQLNVWICGDEMLRGVVNPFLPQRIPYNAVPYEKNPYSFWGVGVAENMEDSQLIMNGHARMAIDNLALSGSIIFDIDETVLVPGQSMAIYPGKVFRRMSGAPGQAVYAIKFPNTSNENLAMFDKFRQLADESTGIPSFSHGQTGVQSMTRTASGMSMLMGAASLNIKTVIKNVDDYLLKPLGNAYFQWNNQFYVGKLGIHGDLEVKALGLASLMQKEVRSQRLTSFLQLSSNPNIAPYVKIPTVIKEFAYSMDLDPRELVNSPEEIKIAFALQGRMNEQRGSPQAGPGGQPPSGLEGSGGAPAQGESLDPTGTGDGTIVPGAVQGPGSDSFSG